MKVEVGRERLDRMIEHAKAQGDTEMVEYLSTMRDEMSSRELKVRPLKMRED